MFVADPAQLAIVTLAVRIMQYATPWHAPPTPFRIRNADSETPPATAIEGGTRDCLLRSRTGPRTLEEYATERVYQIKTIKPAANSKPQPARVGGFSLRCSTAGSSTA
jgi:hypothetical protein